MNLLVDDNDNDMILNVPVIQKRKDRFDLIVYDDDKEMIVIDPVLKEEQDRLDLLVNERQDRCDFIIDDDDDKELILFSPCYKIEKIDSSCLLMMMIKKRLGLIPF